MGNLTGFDASKIEPSGEYSPLPEGHYIVAIVNSELKQNKANTGHYLKLELEVIDGQYKGRKLWVNLNLDHPNAKAVEIARADMSAICRAAGVLTPQDSAELHGIPMGVAVKLRKRPDTEELENVMRGWKRASLAPAAPPPAPKPAPAPVAATKAAPTAAAAKPVAAPWSRPTTPPTPTPAPEPETIVEAVEEAEAGFEDPPKTDEIPF